MYKINKQKCVSCGACMHNCPGATKFGSDGKAQIVDQEKLEKCGGESVCPFGAIEETKEGKESGGDDSKELNYSQHSSSRSPLGGQRMGQGRGMGKGRRRGFGPRDGRGRGMGRGIRR